jgi:hypothetical protein
MISVSCRSPDLGRADSGEVGESVVTDETKTSARDPYYAESGGAW